jgi:hypothetical protein
MPLSAIAADAPAIHASENAARTYRRAGACGRHFGAGMIDISGKHQKGRAARCAGQDVVQNLEHDPEK